VPANLTVGQVRKAIVALIGAASMAVTQGLIEGTAAKWVAIAVILATGAGVYAVPNDPPPAADSPADSPPQAPETPPTPPTAA
jgi:hypothetical protein